MSERGRVVVVTGLSGAGKSTALNALEDLGYFCVDNLPTSLLKQTVEECERGGIRRIGLGIDVRVGSFLEGAGPALDQLAGKRDGSGAREVVILFLDASDEALLRRFNETRRPHPLSASAMRDGARASIAVLDGILLERERLAPLRARAGIELDSTSLSVHDLRRRVFEHLGPGKAEQPRMATRVLSFGYKYGIPVDADLLFDVRFLDNPHFVADLRPLCGTDAPVRDYVLKIPDAIEFLNKVEALLAFCLPRYEREGKSYLTIAIGCTGGRHRSVTLACALADRLGAVTGLPIAVAHRDVTRAEQRSAPPAPPPGGRVS
jgi:RNase adapter protein RapZ